MVKTMEAEKHTKKIHFYTTYKGAWTSQNGVPDSGAALCESKRNVAKYQVSQYARPGLSMY